MTSRRRWRWSSPTCTLASRSHASPGQCALCFLGPPTPSARPRSPPPLPRYWLWYTTKACVGGLARKAWERLRLHRVNLIALQRRRDPEQVLLQCLPRHKVGVGVRRFGLAGRGCQALGSQPVGTPRWMPPCGGCWSGTAAPSPRTPWRCLRVRSSSPPSRGASLWMPVCPLRLEEGPGVCPGVPAEPVPSPRPPRLRGGQGVFRLLLAPEKPEGGVRDHRPGPARSGRAGPGGPVGQPPPAPGLPGQRPGP